MRGERNGSTTIALEIILITELTRGGGRATRFLSANFSLAHSFSLSLSLSRADEFRNKRARESSTRTERNWRLSGNGGMVKIREPS